MPTFKESTAEMALPLALKMLILHSQQPQFPTFSGLYHFQDFQRLPAAEMMSKLLCMPSQDPDLGQRHLFSLTSNSSPNTPSRSSQTSLATMAHLGCFPRHPLGVPAPQASAHSFPTTWTTSLLLPVSKNPTCISRPIPWSLLYLFLSAGPWTDFLELIESSTPSIWQLLWNIS